MIKDRNFLLGLGIGIVITAILMSFTTTKNMTNQQIEIKARELGMKYPDEIKAFFENDKK
ncbi:hypothetical protein [Caloramator mitchellensis]|uniref:hypothetical protein n=1 Tax=Caloramator mitchellensis TaxID=908809 RepID=UPI0007170DF4|nr:hypothetical protein [Caloramator mitchellensis]